jgi:hypothetical protein
MPPVVFNLLLNLLVLFAHLALSGHFGQVDFELFAKQQMY